MSGRKFYTVLAATLVVTALARVQCQNIRADSPIRSSQKPVSPEPRVIQGHITALEDGLVAVKTPDAYPGGSGGHPQYVTAGPTFKVDISRARLLLADGKQIDKRPLAVGDRVLMVLDLLESGSPAPVSPGHITRIYFASIIERIAPSDKIVTH